MNTLDMMSQLVSSCSQSYYQRKDLEMMVCVRACASRLWCPVETKPLHSIIQSEVPTALRDNVAQRRH